MHKMKLFLLFTIVITYLTPIHVKAKDSSKKHEFETNWQKAFGGGERDRAYGVTSLKDGGAMVAGISHSFGKGRSDMLIVKLDKSGKTVWRSAYGGKKKDYAKAITKTSDGNFIAVGATESFSKDGNLDVYVVKFDTEGKRAWQKSFGGEEKDEASAVVAVKGGGVLVAGYTESFGKGRKDVYILYIDKDGKEIWSKAIGGEDEDEAFAITLTADGGFVVAGKTESYGEGRSDFYMLKFDGDGKLLWDKVYGEGNEDVIHGITPTPEGGFVVVGKTGSFGSKHSDIDIIKYSKNGKIIWHRIYGFKSKEWANSITRIAGGGYVVVGTTKSFGFGKFDFYVLELDSEGHSIWANVYGGANKEEANAVTRMADGSILVVGDTESFGNGSYDFFMLNLQKR